MARGSFLTRAQRDTLFSIRKDRASLISTYTLSPNDFELIDSKRGDANRLGLALHIALLRYPGIPFRHLNTIPQALIDYVAELIEVDPDSIISYARRKSTRTAHFAQAGQHLGLQPFASQGRMIAEGAARKVAARTDDSEEIAVAIVGALRQERVVLPSGQEIELIGMSARAKARKAFYGAISEGLSDRQRAGLDSLLVVNPYTGRTPLSWLRDIPAGDCARNLIRIIERLSYVRRIGINDALIRNVPEERHERLVRESRAIPVELLFKCGTSRRHASLTAAILDLEQRLTDAAISMFSALIRTLFAKASAAGKRRTAQHTTRMTELLQVFAATVAVLEASRNSGEAPYARLEKQIGWDALTLAAQEASDLSGSANENSLEIAARRYIGLRRFAPIFLAAFSFRADGSARDLLQAIEVLTDMNERGLRDVPADAPMPFPAKWRAAIRTNGVISRRLYETAIMASLDEGLRSGSVWVERSQRFRRFDDYLLPEGEAQPFTQCLAITQGADGYLGSRATLLDWRLRRFINALTHGRLDGVRLDGDEIVTTPLEAAYSQNLTGDAARVEGVIHRIMPRVRITELLSETAERTGFLECFRELRSGRPHPDPHVLMAAILADATNLGVERMANASQGVTERQLGSTYAWYLSEENYAAALRCLTDAQTALPLARHWGDGTTSSSDAQFFPTGRKNAAGAVNGKYGRERGQKIYTFQSDQYAPFYNTVISATAGEAPYALDGLLHHGSSLEIGVHYVDTGGSSDHVFAMATFLGIRFVPRIRNFGDRRFAIFEKTAHYAAIKSLLGKPVNASVIRECWDEIVRLAATIRSKRILPSELLGKLSSHHGQSRLSIALREMGRIERTLFMLDWLESKDLRRQCLGGLNKGEARNTLARAVFTQKQGKLCGRTIEQQSLKASGLNLVTGAIAYWNTLYMQHVVDSLRLTGMPIGDDLLAKQSPLGWEHITLTGDYLWKHVGGTYQNGRLRDLVMPKSIEKWVA